MSLSINVQFRSKSKIYMSSTACWSYVCNKINDLKDKKRKKVTVSGTQKFGLCEPLVIKLLHNLPGADKCAKYE